MNWIFGVGYCRRLACSNQQQMSLAPQIYIARSRPNAAKKQHHLDFPNQRLDFKPCPGEPPRGFLIK